MKTMQNQELQSFPFRDHFHLRGHQGTQMDGLTDGIFALAVAVLLISSSVPTNFTELLNFVYDLLPFSLCIVFIYWIWQALTRFNLRFGLEDAKTNQLKMVLMFFVLFYIYPLKFLMSWQVKYFSAIFAGELLTRYEELSAMIPFTKLPHLMIIYGLGFAAIFFLLYYLNKRAYKQREILNLSPRETLETELTMRRYFAFASIGLISISIALISIFIKKSEGAIFAGVAYNLVWIFVVYDAKYTKKRVAALETA